MISIGCGEGGLSTTALCTASGGTGKKIVYGIGIYCAQVSKYN